MVARRALFRDASVSVSGLLQDLAPKDSRGHHSCFLLSCSRKTGVGGTSSGQLGAECPAMSWNEGCSLCVQARGEPTAFLPPAFIGQCAPDPGSRCGKGDDV